MSKRFFQQQIQGFRVYTPVEFGSGNQTKQLTIAILLDEKESAKRFPDTYRSEFHLNFRYNYAENRWWTKANLQVDTDQSEIVAMAAKIFADFVTYCEFEDQTPEKFVAFAKSKKILQVWYESHTGRLFSNPATKSFLWSLNEQQNYGNVLALNEKEAMKKIGQSYSLKTNQITLVEQSLDLYQFNCFNANWFNSLQ